MKRASVFSLAALFIFVLIARPASATNGMNMIGYNARASGMGGADVALETDCSGASCNPATLGRTRPRSATVGLSLLMPHMGMENTVFGPNDVDGEDQIFPLPYLAYASHLGPDSPWTLGAVLYAQGGMGVDFNDVNTFAGTVDGFSSEVAFGRLSPSVSYRVSDKLSLGGTFMLGYAKMEFSLYPETYSPGPDGQPGTPDDFAGMEVSNLSSFGYAVRLGAHYRVTDRIMLGFAYNSKTDLDLDGGDLKLNFGLPGKVQYDASMEDFTWPQEVEFGLAFQATPQVLLAADVKWLNWASAVDEVTVKGTNPNMPVPLTEPEILFRMKWEDQWVFAVGVEYALTPTHTLRAGYNYGASPVPDEFATPLFPALVEQHVTVGYGLNLERWSLDLAWEHSFAHDQTNNNPNPTENPFGPGVNVINDSGNVIHAALTYWY